MRDLSVRRPTQQILRFDREAVWQTLPELVQEQCAGLISQLLRAILASEASMRRDDERQDPTRPS